MAKKGETVPFSCIILLFTLLGSGAGELFSTVPNATLSQFVTEDSAGEVVNKPHNSDVIVGEDVQSGSNLLLTCTAPYPVQWVYTGDGRPVLSTNTSVKFLQPERKSESQLDFTAFAMISSPQEKNTGNYTCRSLQDPRVAVSYFIFVPGANIFTSSGGQNLLYSRSDPWIRIPCSVSHPRALVGLQKSVNGLLNCPQNDSISYNPKTGFHLKRSDFPDPGGHYVCTAGYNNTVRYIEFNVTNLEEPEDIPVGETSEAPNSPPEEIYCQRNQECPSNLKCSKGVCIDPCIDLCGVQAECTTVNHIPTCTCPSFMTGDPHTECRPLGVSPSPTSPSTASPASNPCSGAPCGPNGLCKTDGKLLTCVCKEGYVGSPPDCRARACGSSRDCSDDLACVEGFCANPCDAGICGRNAGCRVVNRNPVCYCSPGLAGDPFDECRPVGSDFVKIVNSASGNSGKSRDSCEAISCGHNAGCYIASNGRATCRCRPGFEKGDPYTACFRDREDATASPGAQSPCRASPCGPNTICRDTRNGSAVCTCMPEFTGNPYIGCGPKVCSSHQDCVKTQMCISGRCQDPCSGSNNRCGLNAVCKPQTHSYRCSCKSGYSGDPARQCYPNDEPQSEFNPCNPNPCGKNAECVPHRGNALCRCPQPLLGDPLVSCSLGCTKTSECPNDQVCFAGNRTCVDPCMIYDAGCGPGAACVVKNHSPTCVCPQNTKGDPYVRCQGNNKEKTVPCYPLPCGENAICIQPDSEKIRPPIRNAQCACAQGFVGDPYAGCQQGERCSIDEQCANAKGCLNGRCIDPCKFQGVCGINQECFVRNHKPTCVCKQGYPYNSNGNCYKEPPSGGQTSRPENSQGQPSMPTSRPPPPSRPTGGQGSSSSSSGSSGCSVCGPYSECQITRGVVACSCRAGMVGRPPNCRPECQYDGDCAFDRACIRYKCQDPCTGACGRNALCRVRQRTPVCSCPQGYYGSPLHECKCCTGSLRSEQDGEEVPPADDYIVDESFMNMHQTPAIFPFHGNHPHVPTILIPLMSFNHTGFEILQ